MARHTPIRSTALHPNIIGDAPHARLGQNQQWGQVIGGDLPKQIMSIFPQQICPLGNLAAFGKLTVLGKIALLGKDAVLGKVALCAKVAFVGKLASLDKGGSSGRLQQKLLSSVTARPWLRHPTWPGKVTYLWQRCLPW